MDITALLKDAISQRASDIHIRADDKMVVRVDGKLVKLDNSFTSEETLQIAEGLMNEFQKRVFTQKFEVDISQTIGDAGRFRINIFKQRGKVNLALRAVSSNVPTIAELKLPDVIEKISQNKRGLVLVTGTTGCGKSTTLAAIINQINQTRQDNIITIEDPIEYLFKDDKSIISQREVGFDTLTYAEALRNAVRQDPDVIMMGEMRDLETMASSITAAQTGHLVLSTIHTVDAAQTINRIIDMYPPHQQNQIRFLLADSLKAVVSLRLLPHASGEGRVPAVEVLVVTELISNLIEDNNINEITLQMKQGGFYGMQTFNQSLMNLFKAGEIKLEDALAAASNPEDLMLAIRGVQSSSEDANDFIQRTPDNF